MLLTNIHIYIHVRLNVFHGVKSHGVYTTPTNPLTVDKANNLCEIQTYIHSYHSRFILEGLVETSHNFLQDYAKLCQMNIMRNYY
jgi:hypothetical protein